MASSTNIIRGFDVVSKFEPVRQSTSVRRTQSSLLAEQHQLAKKYSNIVPRGSRRNTTEDIKKWFLTSSFEELNQALISQEVQAIPSDFPIFEQIFKNNIIHNPFHKIILFNNYGKKFAQHICYDKDFLNNTITLINSIYKQEDGIPYKNLIQIEQLQKYIQKIFELYFVNCLLTVISEDKELIKKKQNIMNRLITQLNENVPKEIKVLLNGLTISGGKKRGRPSKKAVPTGSSQKKKAAPTGSSQKKKAA